MKKHSSLVTIVLSVLIIFLGYFAYDRYIRPIYLNNAAQSIEVTLNQEQEVILSKLPEQSSIYGIEIEISPYPRSNYSMLVYEGNELKHDARIKQNREFVFKNEWYSDSCRLMIKPVESSGHAIMIEYRFLGLNDDQ